MSSRKKNWSEEEELLLFDLHKEYGKSLFMQETNGLLLLPKWSIKMTVLSRINFTLL